MSQKFPAWWHKTILKHGQLEEEITIGILNPARGKRISCACGKEFLIYA